MSPSFVLAFLFVLPLAMARGSDSGSHSGARKTGVVKEAVMRVVDRVMKPAVTIKFDKPSPFRRVVDDDDDYDYHMCDANEIDYDDDHSFPAGHGQKSPSHPTPLIGGVFKPKPLRVGGSDSDRAPTVQNKPIALPGIQIPKFEIKPVSEKVTIKVDPVPQVRPLPLAPVVKQTSGSRKVAIKISEPTVRLTAPVFVKQASVSDKVAIKVAAPAPAAAPAPRPVVRQASGSDKVAIKVAAPAPAARPAAPAPASAPAPAARPVVKQASGSDKVAIKVAAPAPAARPVVKQASLSVKATVKVATPVLTRARIAM